MIFLFSVFIVRQSRKNRSLCGKVACKSAIVAQRNEKIERISALLLKVQYQLIYCRLFEHKNVVVIFLRKILIVFSQV
jgi:hypothetical protein